MQTSRRWRAIALVSGGLFLGSLLGPPLAHATTAVIATIKGKDPLTLISKNAGVNGANQLETSQADPSSFVLSLGGGTSPCTPDSGFYTVPVGKALIITGVTFVGEEGIGTLLAGPTAVGGCDVLVAAMISAYSPDNAADARLYQQLQPGIAVPAGDQRAEFSASGSGDDLVYGYLVPASAVPSISLAHGPHVQLHNGRPVIRNGLPVFKSNH
jgi:hypothetical protein